MRIQVNLGDPLLQKVDKLSEMCGVSRSALCSMLISQGVLAYDKSFEVMDSLKESLPEQIGKVVSKKSS